MPEGQIKPINFKIVEAQSKDSGRAIARVDPQYFSKLKATTGDIIQLEGKNGKTVARLLPSYPETRGSQFIQLDGVARENLHTGLDERVFVQKVPYEKANIVVLSPLNLSSPFKEEDSQYLAEVLDGTPVIKGNKIRATIFGTVEKRVVAQLLAEMDGLESRGNIVVIGATNMPNLLDPALRRPGRFDREIVIGIPDRNARKEILEIHTRGMPLTDDVDLEKLAEITHGFVGADLQALAREAAMAVLREIMPEIDFGTEYIPYEKLRKIEVTFDHFQEALKEVEPSALREVFSEIPNTSWEEVGGLEHIKQTLREVIERPLKYSTAFAHVKLSPPRGILLYGPPGCGKTLLARAVATELGVNLSLFKDHSFYQNISENQKREFEKYLKKRDWLLLVSSSLTK